MLNKERPAGAEIGVTYCGYRLQSPFILASGPLTYGSEGMIRGHEAGCGAVVTKTIRLGAAVNPVSHIGRLSNDSIMNCEKWADSDRQVWYEKEIPEAVKAGATVIGSVGHTPAEAKAIVGDVEKAGAHIIELVSYTEDTLLPMLDYAKNHVNVPVICKLSGNWPDAAATAKKCYEHGADGVAAIDSIGPTLKIDIENRRPIMWSDDGYGWTTGAAIKPIALRINADIARRIPDRKNLYGMGGVMNANDAIEYLMAGCDAVGVCTVGILKGMGYIKKMCGELSARLAELGFSSVEEARGAALPNFPSRELITDIDFRYEADKCNKCGRCVTVCSYRARALEYPDMRLERDACRSCGICADVCPTGALRAAPAPQSEENRRRAQASREFDEMIRKRNA